MLAVLVPFQCNRFKSVFSFDGDLAFDVLIRLAGVFAPRTAISVRGIGLMVFFDDAYRDTITNIIR